MALGQGFEGPTLTIPASGAFGPYLRVVLSSGTAALAGANDREIGTTVIPTPASGIGSASDVAILPRNAEGAPWMTASGAISQYARVYAAASGKVSATANGNFIGIALTATANNGEYLIVLRNSGDQSLLFSQVAASTAVTSTSTETAFDASAFTLPANFLRAGDVIKISYQGIATATNSTDTLKARLFIGSTVISDTGALDVANNDIFVGSATLVIRTAGSTGTVVGEGWTNIGTPGTSTSRGFNLASTTIDTTATQAISLKGTWSTTNAGNSARSDIFTVEKESI
jgi:hypothetical protein